MAPPRSGSGLSGEGLPPKPWMHPPIVSADPLLFVAPPGPVLALRKAVDFRHVLVGLDREVRKRVLRAYAAHFKPGEKGRMKKEWQKAGKGEVSWTDLRAAKLELLQAEIPLLARALAAYLTADITPAAESLFGPLATGASVDPARRQARRQALNLLAPAAPVFQLLRDARHDELLFSSLLPSGLLAGVAAAADEAEGRLSPEVTGAVWLEPQGPRRALDEFLLWFVLVRLCIATTIVAALPYREIWGPHDSGKTVVRKGKRVVLPDGLPAPTGIYGTAGWWLSEQVGALAEQILTRPRYEAARTTLANFEWAQRFVTFGAQSGAQFALDKTLRRVGHEAEVWREHCAREGCTPREAGVRWPTTFAPIPLKRLNDEPLGDKPTQVPAKQPDHMYARPRAVERIDMVRSFWRTIRGMIEIPFGTLRFHVTAGSLEHGGAHPPHSSHRNGAMFDLSAGSTFTVPKCNRRAILELPEEATVTEEPFAAGSETAIPRDGPTLTNTEFLDEPDESGAIPPEHERVVGDCVGDFRFPADLAVEGTSVEELAILHTQCMLLTFPSQVLYASWHVLHEASKRLRDRAEDLAASPPSEEAEDALTELLDALPPEKEDDPEQWPGKDVLDDDGIPVGRRRTNLGVLFPREDHADHWHVSYDPADVENPSRERQDAILWIRAHIADLLF